jgi:protein-S-isoprenylcysteine O-methyltransferase Ste14
MRNIPHSTKRAAETKAGIAKRFVQLLFLFGFLACVLFVSSGQVRWLWAWVYLGTYVLGTTFNAIWLLRQRPETIAERGKTDIPHSWEKVVGGLWGLAYFLAIPLVAGLDVRFAWSSDQLLITHLSGTLLFVGGFAVFSMALIENAHFVTVSRVRDDGSQTVCSSGPYRFVRHPGYLGAIVQGLAAPLLLGSSWALVPGLLSAMLMAIRTVLEDKMLHDDLSGYQEYANRIRYRLIPHVW